MSHLPPAADRGAPPPTAGLAAAMGFVHRRLVGDYEVDAYGFDRELTEAVLLSALRPIARYWFRVETFGVEHLPASGPGLVVANHSGTLPWDCLMTALAVHDHHPQHRHLRLLAADLIFQLPFLGELARAAGHTVACRPDAEALLTAGELVGVCPEGYKGVGKPFRDRYRLQRFGRGGFASVALRTGAPIVPCAIVGAEEIYPKIANVAPLARLLGLPYLPITPLFPWLGPLGAIPLPTKWLIEFGEPIRTDTHGAGAADDAEIVAALAGQVRTRLQHQLDRLRRRRRHVF